ncbi:MAG TPA: nuclear transport factor 2 family protein [Pyrinomonadaceae bacterium]|nr:nuclear transport factor 2 family protein [Pyrinomonadaceae bacterium]
MSALKALLAEEYTSIQTEGIVLNNAEELAKAKASVSKYEVFDLDEIKVRIYKDLAVVTSRHAYKGVFQGGVFSGKNLRTQVWIKRKGLW